MAGGLFPRGVRLMATRVVLYHSSQGYQVGGLACFSLGFPAMTNVMGQQGARLGASKGCAPIAEPHPRSPRERDVSLVMVTQVMLIRRVLPCKRRPLRLWEFIPEGPQDVHHFLGMTPVEMYK